MNAGEADVVREYPDCGFKLSDSILDLVCKFGRWPENWMRSLRAERRIVNEPWYTLRLGRFRKQLAKNTGEKLPVS